MSGHAGLRDYEQQKFAIADVLRAASVLADRDNHEWEGRLRELFRRLAEDRFNLVVVGRFSRGKTSLMNALMATDRLPTGIVPITSVITSVAYGSKEKAVIEYKEERRLDSEIRLDQLPEYITQQGNPGNVRGVKLAEVRLPAEILRSGFYFVDTPGLGSAILENTETTEAFLPEADAFLLVTSYDSPLSNEEMQFIQTFHPARPVFVVLNKHDTVSFDDRESALSYVSRQLADVNADTPRLFSVSAREGLEAKLCHDLSRLAESGVPALEEELVHFMLTGKESEFLAGTRERAEHLLEDLPPSQERERLLDRLGGLQGGFNRRTPDVSPTPFAKPRELRACEICAQIYDAQHSFLRRYQYDFSYSEEAQHLLARTHGFCSFHTRQFEAISSQAGLCMGYPVLLERLAAGLREAASDAGPYSAIQGKFHALLPAQESCLLCGIRAKAEEAAIAAIGKRLTGYPPQPLGALSAICLPHLAMLCDALPDDGPLAALAERQAKIFERLAEDLRRFALKWDARRRYLMSAEELAAAGQAIDMLVGHRQVGFPCCSSARPEKAD